VTVIYVNKSQAKQYSTAHSVDRLFVLRRLKSVDQATNLSFDLLI